MNFQRLLRPEIPRDLEGTQISREARRAGGYVLGLVGYSVGVAAFAGITTTAGLSLPILGALSAASYAGGRSLMRPSYRNDHEYAPVSNEERSRKLGRYATFGLGMAGFSIGANLLFGGLFNSFPASLDAGSRAVSVIGGYFAAKYGARAIQGSFDPKLFSDDAVDADSQVRNISDVARESFLSSYRRARTPRATA